MFIFQLSALPYMKAFKQHQKLLLLKGRTYKKEYYKVVMTDDHCPLFDVQVLMDKSMVTLIVKN